MQRPFLRKFQIYWRAVLFFGLLSSLLFSCGEGIRLLPFPFTEAAQSAGLFSEDVGENDYQENVLRFEKSAGDSLTKFQRSSQHHDWANIDSFFGSPVFAFRIISGRTASPVYSGFYKSRLFAASRKSRAPPFS